MSLADFKSNIDAFFAAKTWAPVVGAGGTMTYTLTAVNVAKYFLVGELAWLNIAITGTTAGVASNTLTVRLPFNIVPYSGILTGSVSDGGAVGAWTNFLNDNTLSIHRYDNANFGIGTGRSFEISGWTLTT